MKKRDNNAHAPLKAGWTWLTGFLVCVTVVALAQPLPPTGQRCATADYQQRLHRLSPQRQADWNALNQTLDAFIRDQSGANLRSKAASDTVYRIPVVVHVIHNNANGTIGGANNPNISEQQIASQITVLNEDYRRKAGTNGFNTSAIGADAGIEFFLTNKDPQGQPSTGITRHYYTTKTTFDINNDAEELSQIAYWPSDRYLNIWVCAVKGDYLGLAQFPSGAESIPGLDFATGERIDGAIIDYKAFGRQTGAIADPDYNLGRTTTHEIGHWLGLIHTWGDLFCGDDYVADTPPTEHSHNVRNCNQTYSTCVSGQRTRDLIEDYMDYSPDRCMNLFTKGQVGRMRAVLQVSPRRLRLINSVAALPEAETLTVKLYPNPASLETTADISFKSFQTVTITLYDVAGRLVRTFDPYTNSPSLRVSIPVNNLTAGLYILRVSTGEETVSKRLIIL